MALKNESIAILHLEDNADDVELLKIELKRAGIAFTLKPVATKAELEKAFSSEFQLVITDYNLRNYDGLAAIQWIRERDPIIPIIIFSGTVGDELAVDLLQAGANDFVLKTNIRKIPSAVQKALAQGAVARERILFQEELMEKNLILDTIFNTFEDFVFLKDTEGRYLKVNQNFRDFLELREDEIIGKVNGQIFDEPFILKDDENDELVVKSKRMLTYENEKINQRGKRHVFEIIKKPIIANGKVTGILGTARNISDLKILLENAERAQFILNQAERLTGSGSFEYDTDMDIIHCSGNFSRIFGIEGSSISLRKFTNLVKAEDRPLFTMGINEAIASRKEFYQEHRFITSGGPIGQYKVLLRPDFRETKANLFYGTVVDVAAEHTNAVYLMERLESDRKKISRELHDNLGQKLNAISMYISKISDSQADNKDLKKVQGIVHESIDDLSHLLTTISVKQVEEHSLEYAIDKLLEYVPEHIEVQKTIKLKEEKLSNFVKAQLYRVIQEALNNFAKYSEASRLVLDLRQEGSIVDFNMEDNGVGFDTNKVMEGNGLRNIAHRVKSNNGLINIQSEKGVGTKISIKMPIN